MEYKMILGALKKGNFYHWENNKINQNNTVEDEVNRLLSKGWKLYSSPRAMQNGWLIIYHLVKD